MTMNAAEILALSKAATPGPWIGPDEGWTETTIYTMCEEHMGGLIATVNDDQITGDHRPEWDAKLIAYFDPVRAEQIGHMLAELDALASAKTTLSAQTTLAAILRSYSVLNDPADVDPKLRAAASGVEEPHPTAVPIDWGTLVAEEESPPPIAPILLVPGDHATFSDPDEPWMGVTGTVEAAPGDELWLRTETSHISIPSLIARGWTLVAKDRP